MAKDVIARLKADTSQWESGISQATRSMNKFKSECLNMNNVVGSMSKSLAGLATRYAGPVAAFTAITGAISNNIAIAKEFEQSISGLSSLTGMVGEDLNTLKDYAIQLGGSTTQSASQVAQAFMLIGSQKPELLKNKEALRDTTAAAITLGEAAGIDVTEAAKALTASLNLMGESADQANRYINILAAGSKEGSVDIAGLTDIVFKSGQAASMSKMSFEQFIAVAETIGPKFGSATEAGTALNAMLLKLETQTNDQFKPSVVGYEQAIKNLAAANLSSAEASKLVTETGYKALVPLLQNIDATKQLTESITGTTTAEDQANTNTDNLQGSLQKLSSAWEELNLTINDGNGVIRFFVDIATEAVTATTSIINAFGDGIDATNLFFANLDQKTRELVPELNGVLDTLNEIASFFGIEGVAIQQVSKEVDGVTGAAVINKNKDNKKTEYDETTKIKALGATVGNTDKAISDHIKELKKEREEVERGTAEYKKYTAEIQKYESILNPKSKPTSSISKETIIPSGSILEAEKKLQDLQKAWKEVTTQEGRDTLASQIAEANAQLDIMKGKVEEVKMPEMQQGISGMNANAMSDRETYIKSRIQLIEPGTGEMAAVKENLKDLGTIKAVLDYTDIVDIDMEQLEGMMTDIDLGLDIPDEQWQAIVDEINEQLASLNLPPIELNVKTGGLDKVTTDTKDMQSAWAGASKAIGAASSALGQIEDPGAKIAGIIGSALATLAQTFAMSMKGTFTPWDWIAAGISGAVTLASISGVIKQSAEYHADGGMVGMSPFIPRGTDTVPAMLTPGEIVLNAAQQRNMADNLQGSNNIQVSGGDVKFLGEEMFYTIKAFMQRTGSTF